MQNRFRACLILIQKSIRLRQAQPDTSKKRIIDTSNVTLSLSKSINNKI